MPNTDDNQVAETADQGDQSESDILAELLDSDDDDDDDGDI